MKRSRGAVRALPHTGPAAVRLLQPGDGLGLAPEPLARPLAADELGADALEGDPATEVAVLGQIDDAHATAAQQVMDPIRTDVRRQLGDLGRRRPQQAESRQSL